jgi:membrane protease YdiL (CAAX protease family)
VFGAVLTSIFFVLIHSQYILTPASLLLLVITFGLAWVRSRYSTTASIVAHFIYNFIPLLLALLGSSLGGV